MKIAAQLTYRGTFAQDVADLRDLERAGLDMVSVPEAYTFDAVSQLGYIAAATERLEIASGILQTYSRTPALLAMTAAGVDFVSDGRFTLGIGASGPQVVEGFHGVKYDAPVERIRETIEICRIVWKREKLDYVGRHYTIPLLEGVGTGLGKPLKLINHPVREAIPVNVAALGPKSVAMTAEVANGWEPIFYFPERADAVWRDSLAAGLAKRDPALGTLDIVAIAPCAIGEDTVPMRDDARPELALYIGGMGARGKNFYNTLVQQYGFEAEAAKIQDLYLDGQKDEAATLVPQELIDGTSLVGPEGFVRDRVAALRDKGVTTIKVSLPQAAQADRIRTIERLRAIVDDAT